MVSRGVTKDCCLKMVARARLECKRNGACYSNWTREEGERQEFRVVVAKVLQEGKLGGDNGL